MHIRITMNGKEVGAQEAARALLHPDSVAAKMLRERAASVTCDQHPIQCGELIISVKQGKVVLEHVCCDAFRQKLLDAFKVQSPTTQEPQPPGAWNVTFKIQRS